MSSSQAAEYTKALFDDAKLNQLLSNARTGVASGEAASVSSGRWREAWDVVMVRQALDHAADTVSHYRDAWRDAGITSQDFQELGDLAAYPLLSKVEITADPRRFISTASATDEIRCTSGTTGSRLAIYGSHLERQALARVLQARAVAGPREPFVSLRVLPAMRRLLRSGSQGRGSLIHDLTFIYSASDRGQWFDTTDHFLEVIFEEYNVGGAPRFVELVHVTPPFIFDLLSARLEAKAVDMQRSPVREILLTGGFVFQNTRDAVRKQWNAELSTTYSCSEVNGECGECREEASVFHAGYAYHVEIVSLTDRTPVSGRHNGEIVLTSYFPFQQVMPMIRYCTGDVGEWVDEPCSCSNAGRRFRIIGRKSDVLNISDLAGYPAFLGPVHIGNALGSLPVIPQLPFPRYQLSRVGEDRRGIELRVEALPVECFDADLARTQIISSIGKSGDLMHRILTEHSGALRVTFVRKGGLGNFIRLYPDR